MPCSFFCVVFTENRGCHISDSPSERYARAIFQMRPTREWGPNYINPSVTVDLTCQHVINTIGQSRIVFFFYLLRKGNNEQAPVLGLKKALVEPSLCVGDSFPSLFAGICFHSNLRHTAQILLVHYVKLLSDSRSHLHGNRYNPFSPAVRLPCVQKKRGENS